MARKETLISEVSAYFKKTSFSNFNDFLIICPFTLDDLRKKDRKQEIMQWRQIGMTCKAIETGCLSEAARFFNKDHATVIHSAKCVKEAMQGYHPTLKRKLDLVVETISVKVKENDKPMTEVIGLMMMERRIQKLLSCTE